ncbi:ubiquitin family protein [Cystoisospora suis]|uniref:Ubiquitin family protein n=1 Tax=Cystoisospora suis TaxID=483139 RepID=A0A2C6K244_9APIC|nr:ubiquitin family protein [Cystoisospora suis]
MPADQLRKRARKEGRAPPDDGKNNVKVVEVKMYAGKQPVDFDDMTFQDVIKKLRTHEIVSKRVNIRFHKKDMDEHYNFDVDAASITVDEMKKILIKKLGPPSLTGFNVSNILMYERGIQPGLPLEGEQLRECFGPRPAIDIEVYPVNPEVVLLCKVKKWGLFVKEQFEIKILDHLLLKDLKEALVAKLQEAENPKIKQRNFTVEDITFKLKGTPIDKDGEARLRRKFGIGANDLWLRAFQLKDNAPVIIPLGRPSKPRPAPPEESPAPPKESPASPEDSSAPLEDSSAPPEDSSAPPEDSSAPPEDSPAPPEDSSAPPEDSPAPPQDNPASPKDNPARPHDSPAPSKDSPGPAKDSSPPPEDASAPSKDGNFPASGPNPSENGPTPSENGPAPPRD